MTPTPSFDPTDLPVILDSFEASLPVIEPRPQVLPIGDDDQKALDAIPGLEAACSTGNLLLVHELHARWLTEFKIDPSWGHISRPWIRGAVARAIENNHAEVLSYLVSTGYVVSPIQFGAVCDISRAIEVRSTACLKVFLRRGWDINERTDRTWPATLRYTLEDLEMMKWFLAHRASPNATCDGDNTPLGFACMKGPLAAVKLMFEHGGSIEHGQLLHMSAKGSAPEKLEILDFLLGKGVPINAIEYEKYPDVYEAEFFRGLGTALHHAARKGDVKAVKFLLSRGADPLIKDSRGDGRLPKDWAEDVLNAHRIREEREANPIPEDSPDYIRRSRDPQPLPSKESLHEVIRLVQPSWWSTVVPRTHFTDGKRYALTLK